MKSNRGDTLIEVLFATAIFSSVAVGSLAIMNQGILTSQRTLEITLVRQQMDSLATILRYLNTAYVAAYRPGYTSANYQANSPAKEWAIISENVSTTNSISAFGTLTAAGRCPGLESDGFILNAKTAKFVNNSSLAALWNSSGPSQTFSQIRYSGNIITSVDGIWIEAVKPTIIESTQSNADYIDFHIRACWDSPGQRNPVTLGTIVRLYEPR